jgi:hypothetical protein
LGEVTFAAMGRKEEDAPLPVIWSIASNYGLTMYRRSSTNHIKGGLDHLNANMITKVGGSGFSMPIVWWLAITLSL